MSSGIFKREENLFKEAKDHFENNILDQEKYRELLKGYEKLLKQTKRLVKMSDRTEAELNQLSKEQVKLNQTLSDQNNKLETLSSKLSKYLSPQVYDSIFSGKSEVRVGANRKYLTVFFSDIASFTEISDQFEPEILTKSLNAYLNEMAIIAIRHGATIDKYIGDAIMAVFGLPEPSDQDADHALSAALAMHQELATLNSEGILPRENLLSIGIGIHTDDIVSGNIGSPKRMNYTVIGDGVNLASRLESACKLYGASILVSDSTLSACHGQYLSREVDLVVVKGKLTPVLVHEVFVPSRLDCPSNWSDFLGHYSDSLALYRSRQWSDALESFQQCIALRPSDRISSLYVERCHYYLSDPPGDDWNGVWTLTSK